VVHVADDLIPILNPARRSANVELLGQRSDQPAQLLGSHGGFVVHDGAANNGEGHTSHQALGHRLQQGTGRAAGAPIRDLSLPSIAACGLARRPRAGCLIVPCIKPSRDAQNLGEQLDSPHTRLPDFDRLMAAHRFPFLISASANAAGLAFGASRIL
jgi:hypothetical protein